MCPSSKRPLLALALMVLLPLTGCKRDKQGALTDVRIDRSAKRAKCKTAFTVLMAELSALRSMPEQAAPTEQDIKAKNGYNTVKGECGGEPAVQIQGNSVAVTAWLFVGTEAQCSLTLRDGNIEDTCKLGP